MANSSIEWTELTWNPTTGCDKVSAAVRFLSCEPLIGPLDKLNLKGIDWVIVGGESGANPRPIKPEWAISNRDQCEAHDVAFFFKQWGGRNKKAAGRQLEGALHDGFPKPKRRPVRGKKAKLQASC